MKLIAEMKATIAADQTRQIEKGKKEPALAKQVSTESNSTRTKQAADPAQQQSNGWTEEQLY